MAASSEKGNEKLPQAFPCPKCGAQISVGQQFCTVCGERFEYRCANCGTTAGTISGFCTNCGGKLYQQTQSTEPLAEKARGKVKQIKTTPQPLSKFGAYLGFMAIMLFLIAIIYFIGTSPQGEPSKWLGGGFIFQGKSPPPTPPSTKVDTKSVSVPDLPRFTADQVTTIAKNQSPVCRVPAKRVG